METPEIQNYIQKNPGSLLSVELKSVLVLLAQQVRKVIGKIMKFDQKIVIPANTFINLVEFYQEGRDGIKLYIGSNFKQVLDEATENGKYAIVDISGEVIFQYTNKVNANDNTIMGDMQESFLVTQNDAGRLEMRKRLAVAAYLMGQQPKGEEGILQNNGNVTVIGYPLIKSGSGWRAGVNRYSGVWYCDAIDLRNVWFAEPSFWSRNLPN